MIDVQVIHGFCEAGAFAPVKSGHRGKSKGIYGDFAQKGDDGKSFYGERGGASRFFYCPKASKSERNKGLENFDPKKRDHVREHGQAGTNHHPTVKPIALMRYLCKLITPAGGIIVDPFAGSGPTGIAARLENFSAILIERELDYVNISRARISTSGTARGFS